MNPKKLKVWSSPTRLRSSLSGEPPKLDQSGLALIQRTDYGPHRDEPVVVVVFGQPYQTLMPVVAERVFTAGAEGLGWLLAASGAGALAGAVIVASMSRLRRPATIQVGLAIALGLALVGFSMTRSFAVALALLIVVGFFFSS